MLISIKCIIHTNKIITDAKRAWEGAISNHAAKQPMSDPDKLPSPPLASHSPLSIHIPRLIFLHNVLVPRRHIVGPHILRRRRRRLQWRRAGRRSIVWLLPHGRRGPSWRWVDGDLGRTRGMEGLLLRRARGRSISGEGLEGLWSFPDFCGDNDDNDDDFGEGGGEWW